MTKQVQRIGDSNNAGGSVISTPQTTVYANGVLIAVNGSVVSSHTPFSFPHLPAACRTANGSPNVFINNIPVINIGDSDTCGHTRVGGSPNVFVN